MYEIRILCGQYWISAAKSSYAEYTKDIADMFRNHGFYVRVDTITDHSELGVVQEPIPAPVLAKDA
jgi:hypothetical protein